MRKLGLGIALVLLLLGASSVYAAESGNVVAQPAAEETPEPTGPGEGEAVFCGDSEVIHPVAQRLADAYAEDGVTYAAIMTRFCSGFGMGEIKLALMTARTEMAQTAGSDWEALLDQRAEGMGWGNIWRELELFGGWRKALRTQDGTMPGNGNGNANGQTHDDDQANGNGQGQGQGQGNANGHGNGVGNGTGPVHDDSNGNGPPPWAGPKPKDGQSGPPSHAGPKK